ncbi:Uu.00g109310.m01.CDS01 [Anthostomella pinea]|uniref:Uu.00g109310.m01.CDS01 n=1 Tax=Anthostomella pinea TaxID=933095 RepID=A0AAI8YG56_9PEZI|nr:Uu.00g109310.m01.CDS01 [Anthostomella pinea]
MPTRTDKPVPHSAEIDPQPRYASLQLRVYEHAENTWDEIGNQMDHLRVDDPRYWEPWGLWVADRPAMSDEALVIDSDVSPQQFDLNQALLVQRTRSRTHGHVQPGYSSLRSGEIQLQPPIWTSGNSLSQHILMAWETAMLEAHMENERIKLSQAPSLHPIRYDLDWPPENSLRFDDVGRIRPEVSPDCVSNGMAVPAALKGRIHDALRVSYDRGIIEGGYGASRNTWFVVEKKDSGGLRLINSAIKTNAVTIRDAMIPRDCDTFSAQFAMAVILTIVQFFS